MPARQRPRDAATLVLVRRDGGTPAVLMGRRAGGHTFMPDKWVFPGGRLDRADWHMAVLRDLDAAVADAAGRAPRRPTTSPRRLARALALAAVRETFEEAGLLLGQPAPPPRRVPAAWAPFVARGLLPDLGGLAYLARAITPPGRSRRFDARFFLADASGLAAGEASSSTELEETRWFPLAEARSLDLPTVTRAVLDLVEAHVAGRPVPPPFWAWHRRVAD